MSGEQRHAESATAAFLSTLEASEMRALSVLLDRFQFMKMAGITFDGKRDLYDIFGYDRLVTSTQYREEYRRGGIAKRIVEAKPKATWRNGVAISDDEDPDVSTPFEKAWKAIDKRLNVAYQLRSADILAGQSTYSAILIGVPFGGLDTELPQGNGSPDKIAFLQPFFGGGGPGDHRAGSSNQSTSLDVDVTIQNFDVDPKSPRFGEPLSYRIKRTDLASPLLAVPVHWSRVIHVCENPLDNRVYGAPTLEAVWNLLSDLEKVTGGGAESFFQRARHSLHANIDKDVAFSSDDLAKLTAKFEEYQHNITNVLPTRGVDLKLIEAAIANFGNPVDAIVKQIAGTTGIPMRILTGSEMGSLASEQDADNFEAQVKERQKNHAEPMIVRKLVDRLVKYGYLPAPKDGDYDVDWPLTGWTDPNEQADYAVKLATINKTQGVTVVSDDEIREMAFDLEPLPEDKKLPIGAPERITVNQPPPGDVGGGTAKPPAAPAAPALKAAEDAAMVALLEDAIARRDLAALGKLLNLEALTPAAAIALLADEKQTERYILAKEFVGDVAPRLSLYTEALLKAEFEVYAKQHGMNFDGQMLYPGGESA